MRVHFDKRDFCYRALVLAAVPGFWELAGTLAESTARAVQVVTVTEVRAVRYRHSA